MQIVVDASAILAVAGNEPTRRQIQMATTGKDLIAPPSIPWEIGNSLSALFRRDAISLEKGLAAFAAYEAMPIRLVPIQMAHAIEVASRLKIYAYDAYLIQCAIEYRSPLLTLDQALIRSAEPEGVRIVQV